ncbi:hypothetical protein HK096_007236, partial [Nowakowskiella sp. JEL0078]
MDETSLTSSNLKLFVEIRFNELEISKNLDFRFMIHQSQRSTIEDFGATCLDAYVSQMKPSLRSSLQVQSVSFRGIPRRPEEIMEDVLFAGHNSTVSPYSNSPSDWSNWIVKLKLQNSLLKENFKPTIDKNFQNIFSPEILHMITDFLSFWSKTQVAQTCRRLRLIVAASLMKRITLNLYSLHLFEQVCSTPTGLRYINQYAKELTIELPEESIYEDDFDLRSYSLMQNITKSMLSLSFCDPERVNEDFSISNCSPKIHLQFLFHKFLHPQLSSLHLDWVVSKMNIDLIGLALAALPALMKLDLELSWRDIEICDDAAAVILLDGMARLSRLRCLHFTFGHDAELETSFFGGFRLTCANLESLKLSFWKISPLGAKAISRILEEFPVSDFKLIGNTFKQGSIWLIANGTQKCDSLKNFTLDGKQLSFEENTVLLHSLQVNENRVNQLYSANFHILDIKDTEETKKLFKDFFAENKNIYKITPPFWSLINCLASSNLVELNVSDCGKMHGSDLSRLSEFLAFNKTIRTLELGAFPNTLSDTSVEVFCDVLNVNRNLTRLVLQGEVNSRIWTAIWSNTSLTSVKSVPFLQYTDLLDFGNAMAYKGKGSRLSHVELGGYCRHFFVQLLDFFIETHRVTIDIDHGKIELHCIPIPGVKDRNWILIFKTNLEQ